MLLAAFAAHVFAPQVSAKTIALDLRGGSAARAAGGARAISEIAVSSPRASPCIRLEIPQDGKGAGAAQAAVAPRVPRIGAAYVAEPGATTVDIMVVFDKLAEQWTQSEGGGITNFAQMAVAKMNLALANTELDRLFTFRLVAVETLSVSATSLEDALQSATYGAGAWKKIHERRDAAGADIVTVMTDTGIASGQAGVGWNLAPGFDISAFGDFAYNACAVRAVAVSHTMTHEVGHNLGAGHYDGLTNASQCGPQLYSYSSAYCFHGVGEDGEEGAFHTIMGYSSDGYGNRYAEIPYFSSPRHAFCGSLVGDDMHDNTRTIANTYSIAASWRTAPSQADAGGAIYGRDAIVFDANGGDGEMAAQFVRRGTGVALAKNLFSREGFSFAGWALSPDGEVCFGDGEVVTPGGVITLYAVWAAAGEAAHAAHVAARRSLFPSGYGDAPYRGESATRFCGYMRDAAGAIAGIVEVKIAKPGRGAGAMKISAGVSLAGSPRKASFKGVWSGESVATLAGPAGTMELSIAAERFSGRCGEFAIAGSRDVFSSKARGEAANADAAIQGLKGALNIAAPSPDGGFETCALVIGAKGKARAVFTGADGAKSSGTAILCAGDGVYALAVCSKKTARAFIVWLDSAGGAIAIEGLPGARAGKPAPPESCEAVLESAFPVPGLAEDLLPLRYALAFGAKPALPKGAVVKLDAGTGRAVATGNAENPHGLKLSYAPKTGTFKGSFKVYAVEDGKLKKYNARIQGVFAGSQGFGTASIRRPACKTGFLLQAK